MHELLIERIRTILGTWYKIEYDEVILELMAIFKQQIKLYCGLKEEEEVPIELEFILVEATCARFNRLGAEGFSREGIGEISISYEESLEPYYKYMDIYNKKNNKVKFL